MAIDSGLVDIKRAAELLGVKVTTLYTWCEHRQIPFIRLGRTIRFDLDELQAWVDDHLVEPSEE